MENEQEFAKRALESVVKESLSTPEGWKLVPIEPTEEMLIAGDCHMDGVSQLGEAWEAMLAVTPDAPVSNQERDSKDAWISVDDRLPEDTGQDVLIVRPITNGKWTKNIVDFARFYGGKWTRQCGRTFQECGYWDSIEYWMPLPAPPAIAAQQEAGQ